MPDVPTPLDAVESAAADVPTPVDVVEAAAVEMDTAAAADTPNVEDSASINQGSLSALIGSK